MDDCYPKLMEIAALRPGDILLHYRAERTKPTKSIEQATGSPYTHASIYLGDGKIAEAYPPKVRKIALAESMNVAGHIAVFRSQCGFGDDRVARLNSFKDELTKKVTWYDFTVLKKGGKRWQKRWEEHVSGQLEKLAQYFANSAPPNEHVNRTYFCSALVIACYCVVGIIDSSANAWSQALHYTPR